MRYGPPSSWLLDLAAAGYRGGLALDRARHRSRCRRRDYPRALPVPVISIGNIVVGGAGKTPVVEALARGWLARGGRPGILSRGYRRGGAASGVTGNDEHQLLRRRLPDVPHVQHPDRFRAGNELLSGNPEVDLLLLDDGFQHRRLHRDLDLVVIDATRPLGYGRLLPAGLLREPWTALARADIIVVTRAEDCSPHKRWILETFLRDRFPQSIRTRAHFEARGLVEAGGNSRSPGESGPCLAFSGIGNPDAFHRTLRRLGVDVRGHLVFRDHHPYQRRDLQRIHDAARRCGAQALVCTEKDGVKVEVLTDSEASPLPILQLAMRYALDQEPIWRALDPR